MEYAVHQEVLQANKQDELADLKALVNSLLLVNAGGAKPTTNGNAQDTHMTPKERQRAALARGRATAQANKEARKAKKR